MQRRHTTPLIRTATAIAAATSALLLGTGMAGAIPMPAPNTAAVVTSSSVLEDGEGNACAITGELPKVGEYRLLIVDPTCGSPTRPLMGAYKYVKNGGLSYEQAAAKEAGKPLPAYTKEQTLVSYGMKQPVYLKNNRDAGIVGYLILQVPKVGSVVELHAKYQDKGQK